MDSIGVRAVSFDDETDRAVAPRHAPAHAAPDLTQREADELETAPVAELLAWAARRFAPRIALATGFGLEGCVLVDLIARHSLPIDVFTLDTGLLFPETRVLWERLQRRYGIAIRGVRPLLTLEQQASLHGPRLWERDPDLCCALRKVNPLRAALAPLDAWITGLRRDQTPARARARVVESDQRTGRTKLNPLAAWSARQVWDYVRQHDVPFNPLHEQGYPSIGCQPCTSRVAAGEDPRAGRWRGREKTECGLHFRPSVATRNPVEAEAPGAASSRLGRGGA